MNGLRAPRTILPSTAITRRQAMWRVRAHMNAPRTRSKVAVSIAAKSRWDVASSAVASVILVVRLIQGFFVGGEFVTAAAI